MTITRRSNTEYSTSMNKLKFYLLFIIKVTFCSFNKYFALACIVKTKRSFDRR